MKLNKSLRILKINLSREPYLAFISILMLTITFLTLNLFILSIVFSNVVINFLENKAQINIYFKDTMSENDILSLKTKLEADPRISNVKYVSKADALNIFKEMSKNRPVLLEAVESNPLPASLDVKAKDISDLSALAEEFSKFDNVDDVRFYKDVVNSFRKWSRIIRVSSFILLSILSLVSIAIVLMTIGITINSKGVEVEILKLVGASDRYVKEPLVMQGVFYGVTAALISTVILYLLLPVLIPIFNSLFGGFYVFHINFLMLLGILFIELIFGVALGFIGSIAAIKKYLKY